MNSWFNLFFLLLALPMLGQAQSDKQVKALKKYLVEERFISPTEAEEISGDSLFASVYNLYLKRYGKSRGWITRIIPYRSENLPIRIQRLNGINEKLFSLELINQDTYSDMRSRIKSHGESNPLLPKAIEDDMEVFQYLYEKEEAEKNDLLLPAYLDQLTAHGLISEETKPKHPLKSKIDILKLFKHKLILDKNELPDSIHEAYTYAFRQMEHLDPRLKVTDLAVSTEPYEYRGNSYQKVVIRFSNGNISFTSSENDYDKLDTRFY
ncbi:MAG: hypothetical protein AAGI38_22140, partial [Bacteroidota bacterium]